MNGPLRSDPYEHIAKVYDWVLLGLPASVREGLTDIILDLSPRSLLDFGCGTGTFTRVLAERISVVVGLDASPAMLSRAIEKYGSQGERAHLPAGHSLSFGSGDFSQPPVQSPLPQRFDAVLFSLILHETSADPVTLMRQAFTLAPHVVVLEWRMPERNLDYITAPLVHLIERSAGKEHYAHFRDYMRGGGLHGLAERAGARITCERRLLMGALVAAVLVSDNV